MDKLLASLNTRPLAIGGITLYRLAPQTLAPYRQLTAIEMQQRAARARFEALLRGAQRYLSQGRNLAGLTPQALQALGLVPLEWFGGEPFPTHAHNGNPVFHTDSILKTVKSNDIEVGIISNYGALKPIIDRYSAEASAIYFPYPSRLTSSSAGLSNDPAMMVMVFDRAGLARAAAIAASSSEAPRESTVAPSAAHVTAVPASSHLGGAVKASMAS